ncbi:MAG: DJ-1/PfpI family protein [Deltaproteobacteria bacterium]|jgi:4-methyl-5(b-hydroxyethyl)-thiazole monophosphate biosynthesis|nr:DJ-1/PfpI family protein [Deltaproteobacteria bacterium]
MPKAALFIINGFEEVEAITPLDLMRRGGIETDLVSVNPELSVKGANNLEVKADRLMKDINYKDYDMLVIAGGTLAYLENKDFMNLINEAAKAGKKLAAICVAPAVFGVLGLLNGKKATSYPAPDAQSKLTGAIQLTDPVVTDGNITTSRGPGTAPYFALEIIKILVSQDAADKVKSGILLAA